jgi:hypothetical protein
MHERGAKAERKQCKTESRRKEGRMVVDTVKRNVNESALKSNYTIKEIH